MKNFSLAITMLFCVVAFGQEGNNQDTISKKIIESSNKKSFHSIRCKSSIQDTSHPLYILDGKKITPEKFNELKPESIKSITILKDAAATSLYGVLAQKGAIIITTKNLSKRELRKMKKNKGS